jgi:hypothetical protein
MVLPGLQRGQVLEYSSGVYSFMILRIGFRRLLPVALTFMHLVAVLDAAIHQPHRLSGVHSPLAYHAVEYQVGISMPTEAMEPKPLTSGMRVAMVLNLPALLAGVPIAAFLFHESDMSFLCTSTVFVPALWYGIGCWVDGLLGYRQVRASRPWRGFWTVLSAIVFCVSIVSVSPINLHHVPDTWIGTSLILWSALFLVISASGFVRRSES